MSVTNQQQIADAYLQALFDTDRDRALALIDAALDNGMSPEEVIFSVVIPGIEFMIGGLASDSLVTLSQHFLASEIAEEVTDRLIPRFSVAPEMIGHVIIGTSHGDFHGLGKKIVTGCLRARMFTVTDLGINVPPERFVAAALENNAQVIGISSMMVHTASGEQGARRVRAILKERNLEKRIKLIVGGAPYRFHEHLYLEVGADAWADTAAAAPEIITRLISEVQP
jgi:5-methyltetrahydrofolate--homocysteine methyltransferase